MTYNYKKQKKQARRGVPLIEDDFYDPYKRSGPGDQNGGTGGTTYQSTHGLGDSGFGGHRFTTKRNPGKLGPFDDSNEDSISDFPTDSDGGDNGGSNRDTSKPQMENGFSWYSPQDPNGPGTQMMKNLNSDNNLDREQGMLSRMSPLSSFNVFQEIKSKRNKK